MKLNLRTMLVGMAVFGLAGYAAYAENVTVSTFYPSPFGSYQTLETVTLTATGNSNLATLGGSVGIGTAGPGNALHVVGNQGDTQIYVDSSQPESGIELRNSTVPTRWQLGLEALPNNITAGAFFIQNQVNGDVDFSIEPNGNVGIGVNPPATRLDVAGRIRMQDAGGNPGILQVSCDGANCYAVYA